MSSKGLKAGDPQRVGRYSVLRRLGRGGMSTVFGAFDPELDRHVALKLVSGFDHKDSEGRSRLVREARAMAKISHPNVAPVYDAGVVDDVVYIAMELIEGPTLGVWTERMARPWTEVLRMYLHAGRGLIAAHDAGLVHRDFKPDNVMVGPDGRPRVLDFGLARPAPLDSEDELLDDDEANESRVDLETLRREFSSASAAVPQNLEEDDSGPVGMTTTFDLEIDITRTGVVAGTPAYMSPEQHQGAQGGTASDQFAFCVALWEAIYRQRPFEGASYFALADAIIEGHLTPPPRGHVPTWVRSVLERGLAPDPRERHPSMASLLASFVFTFKVMHGLA